jgi:hypothetical protein
MLLRTAGSSSTYSYKGGGRPGSGGNVRQTLRKFTRAAGLNVYYL